MILSDKSILHEMDLGNIGITNFNMQHLNPNSVDLTLAPECKVYSRIFVETKNLRDIPSYIDPSYITRTATYKYRYEEPLDVKKDNPTRTFTLSEDGYVLRPGNVYLYACNEEIKVKGSLCSQVDGKSSLGRLGLFVHVTAGFIDTGFKGSLVLELVATRPILVYPNMKICQVKFERIEGDVLQTYDQKPGSKYYEQQGVQSSLMHKNFKPNVKTTD